MQIAKGRVESEKRGNKFSLSAVFYVCSEYISGMENARAFIKQVHLFQDSC